MKVQEAITEHSRQHKFSALTQIFEQMPIRRTYTDELSHEK